MIAAMSASRSMPATRILKERVRMFALLVDECCEGAIISCLAATRSTVVPPAREGGGEGAPVGFRLVGWGTGQQGYQRFVLAGAGRLCGGTPLGALETRSFRLQSLPCCGTI